jgi:CubicO group peptidase (beta-lactamase class C family)
VALAERSGTSYGELLRVQLLDPLGMSSTAALGADAALPATRVQGYRGNGAAVDAWRGDGYAGAGVGVWSTAGDLARLVRHR